MIFSTKPHPLKRLGATTVKWAFRRRMSLYTTQFQRPVMAATGEHSCLKRTFVSLAIDPLPSVSRSQISAETEATQTRLALEV